MSQGYRAVIVNYGKAKMILSLLTQLSNQSKPPSSVCIIDNSPPDMALQRAPEWSTYPFEVDLIHRPENIGYAAACNLGARGADWDWLALLNPDIEIPSRDLFERLISECGHQPELGCAGVSQKNPDSDYELVARRFPSIRAIVGKRVPILGRLLFKSEVATYMDSYPCTYSPGSQPIEVDWLQSSFLLTSRSSWESCGGLDERYFVFMADVDYGLRCKQAGLKSILFRSMEVLADGVRSSGGGLMDVFRRKTIRIHLIDAFVYFVFRGRYKGGRTAS